MLAIHGTAQTFIDMHGMVVGHKPRPFRVWLMVLSDSVAWLRRATLSSITTGYSYISIVIVMMTNKGNQNMTEAQNLFTKIVHHKQISVLFILQNLYAQGKCSRIFSFYKILETLIRSTC